MTGERLELVTSFDELRAGMLVVVKCEYCNHRDRGMLITLAPSDIPGEPAGWDTLPPIRSTPCDWDDGEERDDNEWEMTVGQMTVDDGLVFRVIDPDADRADDVETERPKTLERVK